MHTYPYALKRIFFWCIGFPCTKRSPKRNFIKKRSPEWKIDFPYWCERMKKENFRKRDATVSDLARNKHVSLPLALS